MTPLRTPIAVIGLSLLFTFGGPGNAVVAGVPEIEFDPVTGAPLPNVELEAALAEINSSEILADAKKCNDRFQFSTGCRLRTN